MLEAKRCYLRTIETIILEMDDVADCIVYAKSNQIMGQSVNADVVMNLDISNREARIAYQEYCSENLNTRFRLQ